MTARLVIAGMLLVAASSANAGEISLTSTSYPDSVVIQATIHDTGGVPSCGWLQLVRNGRTFGIHVFQRQIGSTTMVRFVDTDVQPSTLYC